MSAQHYNDDHVDSPGAGPSTPKTNLVVSEVEKWREEMIHSRRDELALIVDEHDDLVREAFHLVKFRSLAYYDPKDWKHDNTPVFQEFAMQYDLVRNSRGALKVTRKTRGAAQDLRELVASPTSSPSTNNLARPTGPKTPTRVGDLLQRSKPKPTKALMVHIRSPQTPSRRPLTSPRHPSSSKGPRRGLPSRFVESLSPSPSPSPLGTKIKATGSPPEPIRVIKRIKLVHRPRIEYSDPEQIPAAPAFRYNLPSLLQSFVFVNDETTLPADDTEKLAALAEKEAKKRTRIRELQLADAFEIHSRRVDPIPPDEPKRPATHQDHLLSAVGQVSASIRKAGRARVQGARKVAKLVEKQFNLEAEADVREEQAEEKRKNAIINLLMKEVVKEWKAAVLLVRRQKKEDLAAEQRRRGREHLDAFLEQSAQVLAAQHSELAPNVATGPSRSRSRSRPSEPSRSTTTTDSPSPPRASSDFPETYHEPSLGNEVEDLINLERTYLLSHHQSKLNAVNGDTEPDIPHHHTQGQSTLRSELPELTRGRRSHFSSLASSFTTPVNTVNVGDREDFCPPEVDEVLAEEDIDLEIQMEAEDAAAGDSDDAELNGLGDDAEVPIEELLRRYGYPMADNCVEVYDDDTEMTVEERKEEPAREDAGRSTDNSEAHQDRVLQDLNVSLLNSPPSDRAQRVPSQSLDTPSPGPHLFFDGQTAALATSTAFPTDPVPTSTTPAEDSDAVEGIPLDRKASTTAVQPSPRSSEYSDKVRDQMLVKTLPNHSPPNSAATDGEGLEGASESGEDVSTSNSGSDVEPLRRRTPGEVKQIPPPFLLRGTLRPYQQAGLEWLASLHSNSINGILADEMGLGKTIQTIALLGYLACSKGIWGPHLIVVPTSVLLNWEMEFKRFLPGFRTLSYYGSPKERTAKRQGWSDPHAFNVCITSYQLALADAIVMRRKQWVYMILDEAHNIKNFKSKRWETLLGFKADHRLLLTGTPLQNNLMELWSLLYFLMPDEALNDESEVAQLFLRRQEFKDLFQNPVERAIEDGRGMADDTQDTVRKLHDILRPFLLRRMKSEVEKELPSKFEHIVYCRLSKRQRFLYDEFMSRSATRETLTSGNFLSIVNCLMQLRKVCNHPDLFEVRPIVTSFAMSRSALTDYEVKETLIRRLLLNHLDNITDALHLEFLGLMLTHSEPKSLFVALGASRLDASPHFPFVNEELGDPPPYDTTTIEGWRSWRQHQQHSATICRWKHLSYVNRARCRISTTFPAETLHQVSGVVKPLLPLLQIQSQDRIGYLSRVDAVHSMVQSYAERLEGVTALLDRFAFATPRVVARDLPSIALPEDAFRSGALSRIISAPGFDVLHGMAVKLQIAFPDRSLIQFDCGKLQELASLLRQRAAGGHRVLIFTQMTRVLDILEIFLNLHGYRYLRLDGATKIEQRQIITERFNIDSRIFAFIASSRSGGVGINLTGADTVVFYDSDYNPAMDRQCEDRAHRIGQTREVHIYRFISLHTVEEAMLRKANVKRSLDDMVIQKGEFDWRKILADELDGPSGGKKSMGVGKRLVEALALVEDEEDAAAAKFAEEDVTIDLSDFAADTKDNRDQGDDPTADQPNNDIPDDEEDEQDEEGDDLDAALGSIGEYMVRFVNQDWDFFANEKPYSTR